MDVMDVEGEPPLDTAGMPLSAYIAYPSVVPTSSPVFGEDIRNIVIDTSYASYPLSTIELDTALNFPYAPVLTRFTDSPR